MGPWRFSGILVLVFPVGKTGGRALGSSSREIFLAKIGGLFQSYLYMEWGDCGGS